MNNMTDTQINVGWGIWSFGLCFWVRHSYINHNFPDREVTVSDEMLAAGRRAVGDSLQVCRQEDFSCSDTSDHEHAAKEAYLAMERVARGWTR